MPRPQKERITTPEPGSGDVDLDVSLRPKHIGEFIGQEKVKENLGIAMQAARARGESLDHALLYGPPGLGKTTLAGIIAAEMGVNIKVTSGPAIERAGDLAAIVTNLRAQDILFVDEAHRLGRSVEEVLYPAMEDFAIDIVLGKGPAAKSLRLKLPRFTLIGATTRYALLSPPLRDRFGLIYRLEFYDEKALVQILRRSAKILNVSVDDMALSEVARRSRGTPRVGNRLLKRVRDYAQVKGDGTVTHRLALDALAALGVDAIGLDEIDHKLLRAIIDKFDGGPVGLETVAAAISEESDTIMDVYEPYLLQLAFLERTPRGRCVTRLGYEHLGVPYERAKTQQGSLL